MPEINSVPNPGSPEALDRGCLCPVVENGHGKGAYKKDGVPQFWIASDCPIHGAVLSQDSEEQQSEF